MDVLSLIFSLVIILFSAILHEIAHGYVADRLGDPTARLLGRLTLNPLKHLDPVMSFLIPIITFLGFGVAFGGAKPVPIDPFNLRDGRKDLALISLAGPATNVGIAIVAAFLFKLTYNFDLLNGFFSLLLYMIAEINILLAVFNLVPIPPLDGSKVFSLLLPEREANQYLALGNIGMIILVLLLSPISGIPFGRFLHGILSFALTLLGLPMGI